MGQDAFRQGSKEKNGDSEDMFLWRWGNLIGSAGWNYVFGQKLFGNLMVGYSRFRSHIRQEVGDMKFMQVRRGKNRSNERATINRKWRI